MIYGASAKIQVSSSRRGRSRRGLSFRKLLACLLGLANFILLSMRIFSTIVLKMSTSDDEQAYNDLATFSQQQKQHQEEQCPIPENHTAMDESWLNFAKKQGWLPLNVTTIPPEGAFYSDWQPTLDCPSAFETLQWKSGWLSENADITTDGSNNHTTSSKNITDSGGEITCPPGAPMWTFREDSVSPAMSKKSSNRKLCPESGTYMLPRGEGVLCQNSIRLRPSRNDAAIARAQGLMYRRQLQMQNHLIESKSDASTTADENNKASGTSTSILHGTVVTDASKSSSSLPTQKSKPPHILLYKQDAVSRPALYRNLKTTHRTIQDITDRGGDLGTHVYEFKRHHSMGGSSIKNLTPMLTGLTYDQMLEHSKTRTYVAWAHEEFRRLGYVSINTHNLCRPYSSAFGGNFSINSPEYYFPHKMTDIGWFPSLFCPLSSRDPPIPNNEVQSKCARTLRDTTADSCKPSTVAASSMGQAFCVGGRSRSSLLIEHYLKVREDLENDGVPTFAFLTDDDLHVQNPVDLHIHDEDKATTLRMLEKSGILKDTVVLYVSDHGNQALITLTDAGFVEHKLPFWYMMVPDQVLRERGGDAQAALDYNQHVLTTQPDIHETMLDLAGGRGMGDAAWWDQHGHDPNLLGSSVLQPLSYNRTCDDAGIPAVDCVCGKTQFMDLDPKSYDFDTTRKDILPKMVDYINEELEKYNLISSGVCRKLEFKELVSAGKRLRGTSLLIEFKVQFIVKSPRSVPMEFLATVTKGLKQFRKVFEVGTFYQVSRFAHWIKQCEKKVTDAGGNHHFCDCVEPPAVYGWDFNQTAMETGQRI